MEILACSRCSRMYSPIELTLTLRMAQIYPALATANTLASTPGRVRPGRREMGGTSAPRALAGRQAQVLAGEGQRLGQDGQPVLAAGGPAGLDLGHDRAVVA